MLFVIHFLSRSWKKEKVSWVGRHSAQSVAPLQPRTRVKACSEGLVVSRHSPSGAIVARSVSQALPRRKPEPHSFFAPLQK